MAWMLFKTPKENNPDGDAQFAGQTNDVSTANMSLLARKMTEEPVTHVLKTAAGRTAVTSGHFVDAVNKNDFNGKFPYSQQSEEPPASL